MQYPIIVVPDDASTQLEQLGTKLKFWFDDQDRTETLFKEGYTRSREHWAEKIAARSRGTWGCPMRSMSLQHGAVGYHDYLRWLGLAEQDHDALEELARAGGRRATDTLELVPCPEPTPDGRYELHFFARGLQPWRGRGGTRREAHAR